MKNLLFMLCVLVASLFSADVAENNKGPLGYEYGNEVEYFKNLEKFKEMEPLFKTKIEKTEKGQYQVYSNKIGNISSELTKKEIFYGKSSNFNYSLGTNTLTNSVVTISTAVSASLGRTLGESIGGGLAAGAVVAIIGLGRDYYLQDEEYMRVFEFFDSKGQLVGKTSTIFISDTSSYSEKEIKEIMSQKEKDLK